MSIDELRLKYFNLLADLTRICFDLYIEYFNSGEDTMLTKFNHEIDLRKKLLYEKALFNISPMKVVIELIHQPFHQCVTSIINNQCDAYIRSICEQANHIRQELLKTKRIGIQSSLLQEISGGFRSGLQTLLPLYFLKNIFPHMEIQRIIQQLARIDFAFLTEAQARIGVVNDEEVQSFTLFTESMSLNRTRLDEYQLGKGPGCPASRRVSQSTNAYLGNENRHSPVIREFQQHISQLIKLYLVEPIDQMEPITKEIFMLHIQDRDERALLSNQIPPSLVKLYPELKLKESKEKFNR